MKSPIYSGILTAVLITCLISSCATSKKMALPCPEPAKHYLGNHSYNKDRNSHKSNISSQKGMKGSYVFKKQTASNTRKSIEFKRTGDEYKQLNGNQAELQSESIIASNKPTYESNLYASIEKPIFEIDEGYLAVSKSSDRIAYFASVKTENEQLASSSINNPIMFAKGTYLESPTETFKTYLTKDLIIQPQDTVLHKRTKNRGMQPMDYTGYRIIDQDKKGNFKEGSYRDGSKTVPALSILSFILAITSLFIPMNWALIVSGLAVILASSVLFYRHKKGWYKGLAIAGIIIAFLVRLIFLIALI